MKAFMKVDNPLEVEVTLSITMKVKDWQLLQSTLSGGQYPAWKLSSAITDLVDKISTVVDNGGGDDVQE